MNTEQLANLILREIDPTFPGFHEVDIDLKDDTYFKADIEVIPNFGPESYDEETNSYYGGRGDATFCVSNAEIFNPETNQVIEYDSEELETELKKQSKC